MGRLLLLLIIAFLAWLVWRSIFRRQTQRAEVAAQSPKGEDMVACARCGVNLPRSEAREEAGTYYCRDNPRCLHA